MPSQHRAPDNRDGGADYREGGDRARERSRSPPFACRAALMAMAVANRAQKAADRCEAAAVQIRNRAEKAADRCDAAAAHIKLTGMRAEAAALQARLAAIPKAPMQLPRMDGIPKAPMQLPTPRPIPMSSIPTTPATAAALANSGAFGPMSAPRVSSPAASASSPVCSSGGGGILCRGCRFCSRGACSDGDDSDSADSREEWRDEVCEVWEEYYHPEPRG